MLKIFCVKISDRLLPLIVITIQILKIGFISLNQSRLKRKAFLRKQKRLLFLTTFIVKVSLYNNSKFDLNLILNKQGHS